MLVTHRAPVGKAAVGEGTAVSNKSTRLDTELQSLEDRPGFIECLLKG